MSFLSCACISESTFYRHQRHYLQPAIRKLWHDEQIQLLQAAGRTNKPLCLEGDGRSDSPGLSAKYGSYSVVDLQTSKTLDVQLIQVCSWSDLCMSLSIDDLTLIHAE